MSETKLMREIQIAVSELGHRVFRNNSGLFTTDTGKRIRTGLGVGSSDLCGWMGDGTARFLAIEVKTSKGKPTDEQMAFIEAVKKAGGVAFIARSVDEAVRTLNVNYKYGVRSATFSG